MNKNWISKLMNDWNASRIIRLAFGVGLMVMGFVFRENILVLLGALLTLQGVLNISCCGSGGCNMSGNSKQLFKDDIKMYRPKK